MGRFSVLVMCGLFAGSVGVATLKGADAPAPADNGGAQGGQGQAGGRQRAGQGGQRGGMMNPYANQYDQMERTLDLTDDEKTKVKDAVDAMNKELDGLREGSMTKMRDAMQNGGGDRQQVAADMKTAGEDYQKAMTADQAKIDALLTPEQQATWESYKLTRSLQGRFSQLELTDDQKGQIKDMVDAAGKDLAGAKDEAGKDAIAGRLVKKVVADVLTEEQAGKMVTVQQPMMGMMGGMGGFGGGGQGGQGGRGGQGNAGGGQGNGAGGVPGSAEQFAVMGGIEEWDD